MPRLHPSFRFHVGADVCECSLCSRPSRCMSLKPAGQTLTHRHRHRPRLRSAKIKSLLNDRRQITVSQPDSKLAHTRRTTQGQAS